jgi:hypothetical protein
MYIHPLLSFLCPLFGIMVASAFESQKEKNDKQLKTAFGLSIGSIFLMLGIIFYLCYRNYRQYRVGGREDLEPLEP